MHLNFNDIQILFAEDNIVNQLVTAAFLSKLGCKVTIASNGKEAMTLLINNHYDLILMDCQMPEMDGYEATEAIRIVERNTGKPRVPIVALTANAMKGDDEKCYAAGMDDYLTKPVKQGELEEILIKWLPDTSWKNNVKGKSG